MKKDWERDKNVVSPVWNNGYQRYDLSIDEIIQKIKESGYNLEKTIDYEDDLDPNDNYILEIHSEKGTVITSFFNEKTQQLETIDLILKPRIYKNGIDITNKMDMKYFKWVRTSSDSKADAEWNLRHAVGIKDLYITNEDVKIRAVFHCAFLTGAAELNFVTNMYAAYMSSINKNKGG